MSEEKVLISKDMAFFKDIHPPASVYADKVHLQIPRKQLDQYVPQPTTPDQSVSICKMLEDTTKKLKEEQQQVEALSATIQQLKATQATLDKVKEDLASPNQG